MSPEHQKYGAPKQDMLVVVTIKEKWYASLADKEFTPRVDNIALRWLKTYSMNKGMIGRWITALDRFKKKIVHRTREKHFNADGLSKKTEFYEQREERRANEPKMKPGFSFLSKEEYEILEPTPWLDANGRPNGLEVRERAKDKPGEEKSGQTRGWLRH